MMNKAQYGGLIVVIISLTSMICAGYLVYTKQIDEYETVYNCEEIPNKTTYQCREESVLVHKGWFPWWLSYCMLMFGLVGFVIGGFAAAILGDY